MALQNLKENGSAKLKITWRNKSYKMALHNLKQNGGAKIYSEKKNDLSKVTRFAAIVKYSLLTRRKSVY